MILMVNPLAPEYEAFLAIYYNLPLPFRLFIDFVLLCFGIAIIVTVINKVGGH